MKYFSKLTAALFIVPVLAFAMAAPVRAASEGQIEGGNIYRVKNVTKNVDFTDPANADACDVLQYKVRIHDPGPGALTDVRVKADLPSGAATSNVSTITVSAINADPSSTTDTATVNLSSSQSISYQNGTTQLLDANGNPLSTLSDGITQGGVGIGNVGVSINEKRFVQFQAKVSCPTPSPTTFNSTQNVTATATASANATCPPSQSGDSVTVSANGSATASANATSNVSQADADQKAHDAAMKAATPSAQANAQANANVKAQASVKCSSAVVTVVTSPPAAKALPNTGPGSVVGLFAGVSAIAGAGHYFVTRRVRQ